MNDRHDGSRDGLGEDGFLRRAFRELPAAEPHDACPSAEHLAASACGEAGLAEEREVLDHLARCGACAAAWSAVRDAAEPDAVMSPAAAAAAGTRAWLRLAPLAATLLVAAVGVGVWWVAEQRTRVDAPVRRAVAAEAPEPLHPLATLGPPWELRWSAGPEGTVYDVHVTTLDLDELHRALRWSEAVYRIPEEARARIQKEEAVVWQVVAHRPDGESHASRSVVVQVAR